MIKIADAMHRLSKSNKTNVSCKKADCVCCICDSTPHYATVKQVFPVCPGKPYASATFGDDPFHQTTALRKPTGKNTLDATHLYQIVGSLSQIMQKVKNL
jgi:hypothetical protein